jgi:hypothetical protein
MFASFNSNTTGDINGRGTTYLEHPLLLVIIMEEELPIGSFRYYW